MNRRIRDRLMTAQEAAKWIQPDMWVVSAGFYHPQTDSEVFQAVAQNTSFGKSPMDTTNQLDLHWQAGWKCPDMAVLNVSALFSEGFVPTTSIANSALLAQAAKEIILEWNVNWPSSLIGLHDIYEDACQSKVVRVPVQSLTERFGTTFVPIDWSKVIAVVKVEKPLSFPSAPELTAESVQIANHLLGFLQSETHRGRLPQHLPPLQTSPGAETRALLRSLRDANWKRLSFFTDVLDDTVVHLIRNGQVIEATASTLDLQDISGDGLTSVLKDIEEHFILRPQGVITASDWLPKLGLVSINAAGEVDLVGNVQLQPNIWNTLENTQDFARHARLSIVVLPSSSFEGLSSRVVHRVRQVDLAAREIDVIVTEQGIADLRGKSPLQRTEEIIEHCAAPNHRSDLRRAAGLQSRLSDPAKSFTRP